MIWHDGIGYSYWEACSEIFQNANELLNADLEQLGVKVTLKKSSTTGNKSSVNRSMFEFNETFVDSIIQSQSNISIKVNEEKSKLISNDEESNIKDKNIENPVQKVSKDEGSNISMKVNEEKSKVNDEESNIKDQTIEKQSQRERNLPLLDTGLDQKILSQNSNRIKEINSLEGLVLENTILIPENNKNDEIVAPCEIETSNVVTKLSQNTNLKNEINSLKDLMLDTQLDQTNKSICDSVEVNEAPKIQINDSFRNEDLKELK